MYAIITYLRKPNIKIITLENPVEYKISGIEQSPVHPGDGYDFAEGLRASLRQDPDVLMVGEIRDAQTAEISIQAALTGHLLLSTIHANSAPAVFVRLLDIGVEPYLLAGSINLIMAQRLVRKICLDCREEYAPTAQEWEQIRSELLPIEDKFGADIVEKLNSPTPKLYRGKGCEKCHNTGYKGRQIIVEYLRPEEKMEALIGQKSSVAEFDQLARDMGMITMRQDGLSKAVEGTSTLEEIERVTRE
jgi:type II secretory ATPase GspE/PulE/Tfp pilus assembly ATPase PilB-like protein